MITGRRRKVVFSCVKVVVLRAIIKFSRCVVVVGVLIITNAIGVVAGKVGADLIVATHGSRKVRPYYIGSCSVEDIVGEIVVIAVVCFDCMIGRFVYCFNSWKLVVTRLLCDSCMRSQLMSGRIDRG